MEGAAGVLDDEVAAVGKPVRWNARGWGFSPTKSKPSGGGSVPGVPLQTDAKHDGGGCWGAGDKLVVVALVPNRLRRGWGILGPKLPKPCSNGLV
jgi:hypothetical protein